MPDDDNNDEMQYTNDEIYDKLIDQGIQITMIRRELKEARRTIARILKIMEGPEQEAPDAGAVEG